MNAAPYPGARGMQSPPRNSKTVNGLCASQYWILPSPFVYDNAGEAGTRMSHHMLPSTISPGTKLSEMAASMRLPQRPGCPAGCPAGGQPETTPPSAVWQKRFRPARASSSQAVPSNRASPSIRSQRYARIAQMLSMSSHESSLGLPGWALFLARIAFHSARFSAQSAVLQRFSLGVGRRCRSTCGTHGHQARLEHSWDQLKERPLLGR
jgi:hypothetical protein